MLEYELKHMFWLVAHLMQGGVVPNILFQTAYSPPRIRCATNQNICFSSYSSIVRKKKVNKNRVHKLSRELYTIWEQADCCPVTITNIRSKLSKLIAEYKKLLNDYNDDGSKRNKKGKKRAGAEPPPKKTRASKSILRGIWDSSGGKQLFDV